MHAIDRRIAVGFADTESACRHSSAGIAVDILGKDVAQRMRRQVAVGIQQRERRGASGPGVLPEVKPFAAIDLHRRNQLAVAHAIRIHAQVNHGVAGHRCRYAQRRIGVRIRRRHVAGRVLGKTGGNVERVERRTAVANSGFQRFSLGRCQGHGQGVAARHHGRSDVAHRKAHIGRARIIAIDVPHQLVPVQPALDVGAGGLAS